MRYFLNELILLLLSFAFTVSLLTAASCGYHVKQHGLYKQPPHYVSTCDPLNSLGITELLKTGAGGLCTNEKLVDCLEHVTGYGYMYVCVVEQGEQRIITRVPTSADCHHVCPKIE